MEPMNTTARYTADKCEVWVPTQDGEASFAAVLAASGLPAGKCEVYKTSAAGSAGAAQALAERTFLTVYGSPPLQSAVGIDPAGTHPLRRAPKNPLHAELLRDRVAELKSRIPAGGLREAVIRGLLYAGMTRATIDERGFEAMRRIRETHGDLPLPAFKALVREQFNMLLIDPEAALAALPSMLPSDPEIRRTAFGLIKQVLSVRGEMSAQDRSRLNEVGRLFGIEIAAAHAGSFDLDDHLTGSRLRIGEFRELQFALAEESHAAHGLSPCGSHDRVFL
jgi:hypothetical protein